MKDKKVIVIVSALIVGLAISCIIYRYVNRNNTFMRYKIKKSQPIVSTIHKSNDTIIPSINIKGEEVRKVNQEILEKAEQFLKNEENVITYSHHINGDVLSIAMIYIDYTTKYYPDFSSDVYNINIREKTLLTDEDILNMYQVTSAQVEGVVEGRFSEFYQDLLSKKILDGECNYDCFLSFRKIENENYTKDSHLYVKQGNLYVVKAFPIYSPFSEEDYFTLDDFYIQITE